MASATRPARKQKVETTKSHSLRTPNDLWDRATARASRAGIPINRVLIELLEGYARGVYRLPKKQTETTRVYSTPDGDLTTTNPVVELEPEPAV